ncbi:hypothetical protein ACA910_011345 [Epithemia clementina (nom. ined.)]
MKFQSKQQETTETKSASYAAAAAADNNSLAVPFAADDHNDEIRGGIGSNRTWTDTYFDDKVAREDLVAVYDVNYEAFKQKSNLIMLVFIIGWICWLCALFPLLIDDNDDDDFAFWFPLLYTSPILFSLGRTYYRQKKTVYGRHVAVTRQGIRKDSNHFPCGAHFHTSTMMPFGEISKIFVRRLCFGAFGRGTVHVISAADETPHVIDDLVDPDGLVELVNRFMVEAKQQQQ